MSESKPDRRRCTGFAKRRDNALHDVYSYMLCSWLLKVINPAGTAADMLFVTCMYIMSMHTHIPYDDIGVLQKSLLIGQNRFGSCGCQKKLF